MIVQTTLFTSKKIFINKDTVESYEEMGSDQSKSMGSGVARGAIGAALFGGLGALAGTASAKNKGTHLVSIIFKDGTKALCELDNDMYKSLITVLY